MSVATWKYKLQETIPCLAGLVGIQARDELTFVWASTYHMKEGRKHESAIRQHLKKYATRPIRHITVADFTKLDPIATTIYELGGRISRIEGL